MRSELVVAAVVIGLGVTQVDPQALPRMVATERAFAAATAELGVRDGFLAFFADDAVALEAGPEGLDTIRRLLLEAPAHLNPGGVIFLEIAYDQGESVMKLARALLPQASTVALHQDYHGYDRLVVIGL